MTKSEVI